jgi:hypothetical protein
VCGSVGEGGALHRRRALLSRQGRGWERWAGAGNARVAAGGLLLLPGGDGACWRRCGCPPELRRDRVGRDPRREHKRGQQGPRCAPADRLRQGSRRRGGWRLPAGACGVRACGWDAGGSRGRACGSGGIRGVGRRAFRGGIRGVRAAGVRAFRVGVAVASGGSLHCLLNS